MFSTNIVEFIVAKQVCGCGEHDSGCCVDRIVIISLHLCFITLLAVIFVVGSSFFYAGGPISFQKISTSLYAFRTPMNGMSDSKVSLRSLSADTLMPVVFFELNFLFFNDRYYRANHSLLLQISGDVS